MGDGAVSIAAAASYPDDWARLRDALWPGQSPGEHRAEIDGLLCRGDSCAAFVAIGTGAAVGFVECALRTDYVNGCTSSPAGFIEGLYVEPPARGRGIARRLVDAAASWARERGCRELASDVLLENLPSQAVHRALGFRETERVVFYKRELR